MTARQAIGCWCLAMLVFGIALGFGFAVTSRRPHVCDHVVAIPYKTGERPLCVQVKKETE